MVDQLEESNTKQKLLGSAKDNTQHLRQNEDIFVSNVGEKRYLWTARAFAVITAISLCCNIILILAISQVIPLHRIEPFLLTFQNKEEQVYNIQLIQGLEDEKAIMDSVALLSSKPVIYACNMSEEDFMNNIENNVRFNAVRKIAEEEGSEVLPICAELEAQIAPLEKEEKELFLSELGLEKSGLDRLIKSSYHLLGLISYLTAGKPEVRAWTITNGTKAPQAAGKIHSDFERGFIRAEVIAYDDLIECGSMAAAKEKGLVRSEGKEYVMKDGDIVLFRFNV